MEFEEFPKIPRFSRECVITEKIDGTNAQVYIEDIVKDHYNYFLENTEPGTWCADDGIGNGENWVRVMKCGSRTKWLSRGKDNFGFCNWAFDNAQFLMQLGPGRHYGEWWGDGIQRGYGLKEKRFSLFNSKRWTDDVRPSICSVVPIVIEGMFGGELVDRAIELLRVNGSLAAPGFMKPEGIVIYHKHGDLYFKKTLEKDEVPKGNPNA
jgi:hypothetical protein